jgi:hypothetical protein
MDTDVTIKRISEPARFLVNSGLLFEINRQVLHPLGLALEVVEDEDSGIYSMGGIWDYRDDPEGILFAPKTFKDGLKKLNAYMDSGGRDKIARRKELLGYVVQEEG